MSLRHLGALLFALLLVSCDSTSPDLDFTTPDFHLVVTDSAGTKHYLTGTDATWSSDSTTVTATFFVDGNMYSARDPFRVDMTLRMPAGTTSVPAPGEYPNLALARSGGLSVLYGVPAGSLSYSADSGAIYITHSTPASVTGTIHMLLTSPSSPSIHVDGRFQAVRPERALP